MNHPTPSLDDTLVEVRNADAASGILLVCEHASSYIPPELTHLGLSPDDRRSHAAWDPGAMALATLLATRLNATLVASTVSRLVYDCNRPPDAPDAMLARSETVDVPGNVGLSEAAKSERTERFYRPFQRAVAEAVARKDTPILVTVHSFTRIYHGQPREVEIGVLHDQDTRLADALLSDTSGLGSKVVRRNEPYGPADGVTHTLREHALPNGHLNVMLEVRSDLIADEIAQKTMAETLANWLMRALTKLEVAACKT